MHCYTTNEIIGLIFLSIAIENWLVIMIGTIFEKKFK